MSYADLGTHWLRSASYGDTFSGGGSYDAPPCHTGASYEDCRPGFAVGFTLPKIMNDKMRSMDLAFRSLDTDYALNVPLANPVHQAWKAKLASWELFFRKTLDNQLFNFIGTDEQAATINSFNQDLSNFFELYRRQLTSDGKPVPPPSGVAAPPPIPGRGGVPGEPPSASVFSLLPWWGWTLAVTFLGAVGYSFYRAAQHAKEREEYLFKNVVPALVPHVPSATDPGL